MLFTRCPDCATTFRITPEALRKASGPVRCGRCASVFNAYLALRDDEAEDGDGPSQGAPADQAAAVDPHDDGDALAPQQIQETLEREPVDADVSAPPVDWLYQSESAEGSGTGWWAAGAAIALLALGLQGIHHFRSEFAAQPLVGPALRQAYAHLGMEVAPLWSVQQYQILDSAAAAQPSRNSLRISARIHNRGPRAQPPPLLHLQLRDRWDAVVASRVFRPPEYLDSTVEPDGLMSPGATVAAELEIVDPGPDTRGFELDVCVNIEADALRCARDRVFQ